MDEKIMKYVAEDAINNWEAAKLPLDNFLKELSTKPKTAAIKTNKFAGNSKYLEIGYIEAQLDRKTHGLWNWENVTATQMINGVAVTGDLRFFHPIASVWITRSGVGFKQFQLSKGKTDPSPENLSAKALERDIPIAAAEAFKNAAKKLGNTFGRSLNRDFKHDHVADDGILDRIFNNNQEKKEEKK